MTTPCPAELVEALRRESAYGREVGEVGLLQTHISLLFFAGGRVYKVKKPVDLGFLDYTTLEQRRHFCEEEVRLNRRLARDVYLGVVSITRGVDGSLRVGGAGETVEYAVEMLRLPESRMMDRLLEAGEVDNEQMNALASLLATFHRDAATGAGVDEHGGPVAVAFNVRENFEQTQGFAAPPGKEAPAGLRTLSPTLHSFLVDGAERFLATEHRLLERRVREGRIRDGHGDLHAANICLRPEGIAIYDCIEFAPRFRCGDVASDLGFLAMDLDYRGFRGFARYLAHRYSEHAGDPELGRLLDFYKAYRAVVRAKVASLAAMDKGLTPAEREARRLEALRYFHLAASYCLPPALLLTCGLPATGKTTVARGLALPFEAVVLHSDERRKRLAGLPPIAHAASPFGTGLYTTEMTERTYGSLLEDAERALRGGRSVVVDGTFATASRRRPFAELAARLDAPFVVVELTAPEETVRARMAERSREAPGASDADFEIYLRLREIFEPPAELPAVQVVEVVPLEPPEEITARAIDLIVLQARGSR